MSSRRQQTRRIALFVEGHTERGSRGRSTLPAFFHNWLDPQLPKSGKVGIKAIRFDGVSDYLDNLASKVEENLDEGTANFAVGLLDLYGLPPSHIDLTDCVTVEEKVKKARKLIRAMVPKKFRKSFRQHFAVHEVEAWLLAYPEKWPAHVRGQIEKKPPEEVDFDEPPAKFLKRILGGLYKKTVRARNLFPEIDPQVAIGKCPYLRCLAEDLLKIARQLQ